MKKTRARVFIITSVIILPVAAVFLVARTRIFSQIPAGGVSRDNSPDTMIANFEQRVQAHPQDQKSFLLLAGAYLQKVRETADVSYYQKIDGLMNRAEAINKDNPEVSATRATVALGRHHFRDAAILGEQLVAAAPRTPRYYGILTDACVELGRYADAAAALQKMVDLRPDFSSFSRISYLRELHGDIKGAEQAMEQAVDSGAAFPENIAWAYTELGKLYLRSDLNRAGELFDRALQIKKDYPAALEGLGLVAFARNDNAKAEKFFAQAYSGLPIAQFAIDLGNLSLEQKNKTTADQYFTLAKIAFEKSLTSGVDTDLEYAVFLADHDKDLPLALEKARTGYENRPGIFGADTLAWVLYKNGNFEEAARLIAKAMALGEHTPATLFHAGMIEDALGHTQKARYYFERVQALHPNFSIQYSGLVQEKLQNP
ncbi:MAG: tetratricopeptide repeat protein [Candidatus Sungbacteria bacterium]|nr:tetratricopeptide repeat protein [Candidatus Sungbacteria bacterium]